MASETRAQLTDITQERARRRLRDWMAAFDDVLRLEGTSTAEQILRQLSARAAAFGVQPPFVRTTPYVNTIPAQSQPKFPGDLDLERRIDNLVRYNALAMVTRANAKHPGIGGHISTYASASTLFEVGFNHFFKGENADSGPDQVYYQGHASPGVYARAYLEGRLSQAQADNFRRELRSEGGLASYPHPWFMPGFWELPTVSMGLSPLMAVYQARFNRYLENRGLRQNTGRVWALLGDGEMDEPESVGGLRLAAEEELDNLTFVINCNLQRLDGPVRGGGKLIQELEALFRGAGWHVIKVIWGSDWDPLLERDFDGRLVERMQSAVDGDYQRYVVEGGALMREHFFGADPELSRMVEGLSDAQLSALRRGGHDIQKVYAAYAEAVRHRGAPTVVLAKTVKGFGLGTAGEGRNVAHKTTNLKMQELRAFRDRFQIPLTDAQLTETPFYHPGMQSPEVQYIRARREALGGSVPARRVRAESLQVGNAPFSDYFSGTQREATTTAILVRLLADLLKQEPLGARIVPVIPDEARTFGLEALFPQVGIYNPKGQQYEPVDRGALLSYQEASDGQILEEGLTEAGCMASAIAAGTAYATHALHMIPFFFFYSMFGFQRVGDLIWAAGDARARGFLIGATAGRTTLPGEGLQHCDGHSHLTAYTHPRVLAYDPAFGYEVAVIVRDGLRRMVQHGEDLLYYLTVTNETNPQPPMPEGVEDGILAGMYLYRDAPVAGGRESSPQAQLLASGALLRPALEAQNILTEQFEVAASVWSVTSWKQLYEDATRVERHNRLHPRAGPQQAYIQRCLGATPGAVVGVSDFLKALPHSLGRWLPRDMVALGTDGFGPSGGRDELRAYFEVNAQHIAYAALYILAGREAYPAAQLASAAKQLGIEPDKADPMLAWQKQNGGGSTSSVP